MNDLLSLASQEESSSFHYDDGTASPPMPSAENSEEDESCCDADDDDDDEYEVVFGTVVDYPSPPAQQQQQQLAALVSPSSSSSSLRRLRHCSSSDSSQGSTDSKHDSSSSKPDPKTTSPTPLCADLERYSRLREMTPLQERWNALTMLPAPLYCWWFLLQYNQQQQIPAPVWAVTWAIFLHAPASMLYHGYYAPNIAAPLRLLHWSRRLDHAMIHVASTLLSYATSHSVPYLLLNVVYNARGVVAQCDGHAVSPQRNKRRIFISVVLYTLPLLWYGHDDDHDQQQATVHAAGISLFLQCWLVLGLGGWLFATYPIGGWSHCAFHLVLALLPPLVLNAAVGK
jgi:hypothetical protein